MYVGIVGAGVSGLYTALLLRREGHKVKVFEAADRVGGRIYTHRFTPQEHPEGVYFEAGAMRVPRSSLHSKVFDLIRYLNTHSSTEKKIDLIPYILDHENNLSFFQNQKGSYKITNGQPRLTSRMLTVATPPRNFSGTSFSHGSPYYVRTSILVSKSY